MFDVQHRLVGVVLFLLPCLASGAEADRRSNVLFIAVDDLRPSLGCYGDQIVKSPHIDRLAKRGMVFRRAYCQQAICGATRSSLLTGLRPDTTRCWGNRAHFRRHVPNAVALPQHFKQHGYHTEGMGKIFHGAFRNAYVGTAMHDPRSWSVDFWMAGPRYYFTPEGVEIARQVYARTKKKTGPAIDGWVDDFVRGLSTEAPDVADNVLYDGQVADRAIESLGRIKDRPFFLAVGFLKPHLPFIAPKKYWELYDPSRIRLADNPFAPKGTPPIAMHNWSELRYYHDVPNKGPLDDELAHKLIHGYYACISFIDAQVGRVLDELDRLGLREKTIVVLWGDHGWHLGENAIWGKATNFELSTRSPLIVSSPRMKAAGRATDALVEFVDIYPSLCELGGLPLPESSPDKGPPQLEGYSFAPLLDTPDRPWKTAAFSQYHRSSKKVGGVRGDSMRTDRYRFTEWTNRQKSFRAVELYDHQTDPEENKNIADRPENADLVEQLTKKLHAGWRAALPAAAAAE